MINKQYRRFLMPQQDYRARIQPKNINRAETVLGIKDPSNILFPLYQTNGVLFPYTPTVTTGSVTEYDNTPFIHSNYGYNSYVRSYPKTISISAEFTAQSNDEALYLLAVMHFFRSITKSYFGVEPYNRAGTPPPTLLFNYLGEYQFNNVPVVIKSFDYVLPGNINYVAVDTGNINLYTPTFGVSLTRGNYGGFSYVPTHLAVQIELDTQYIPINLRNDFNLDKFRSGELMRDGKKGQGFI
jgi:hypothetical protein